MIQSILFMGTPDFAVKSLEILRISFPKTKITVFSQPDKVRGRGKKTSPTPVKSCATQYNLATFTPKSKYEVEQLTKEINPDIIIVVAYGMMIPKSITDHYICLNIHGSLLPKYRGASPIQSTLLNGDRDAGISIIKLTEKMDAGPILSIKKIKIEETDNCATLFNKLADLGANELTEKLTNNWPFTSSDFTEQNESDASYCGKINKEDTELQSSESAEKKYNKIRAFSPKPGAFIHFKNKRLKILSSKLNNNECIPVTVQPEGKKAMSFDDFCLGNPDAKEIKHV